MRTSIPILFLLPATVALAYEAAPTDPKKLHGYQWMNRHNDEWLPELAARYGCEIADVRGPFLEYLRDHGLQPADVLNDGTHFNFQGDYPIAELTGRHLRYDPALPRNRGPFEPCIATWKRRIINNLDVYIPLRRSKSWRTAFAPGHAHEVNCSCLI
jgi:hypothetical protein